MNERTSPAIFGACLASLLLVLASSADGAVKERVYTMGDNDTGAVVGQSPLVGSSGRIQTEDTQPSTTDYRGTDPPNQQNVSLVPLKSFNANFAPLYALATDRPGAAGGNLALQFDGVNDNMFSDAFDPRDFSPEDGTSFNTLSQVWVKPTSASFTGDQFIYRIGVENGGVLIKSTGNWAVRTGNVATPPDLFEVVSPLTVTLNQWTHLAVSRGGNFSVLYVNGAIAAVDTGFWGQEGPEVTVGADTFGTASFYKGLMDNFTLSGFSDGTFSEANDLDFFADMGISFSGVAGDVDQDGLVNDADYDIWSDNFGFSNGFGLGDPTTLLLGDVDDSGDVDLYDFRIIQQQALAAGTPLTIGVPEPTSTTLLLLSSALLLRRQKRSRSNSRSRPAVTGLCALVACCLQVSTSEAAVVVADDFLYDGPSKPLHIGGGFTGDQRYDGGQNGPAGSWTGLWGQIGDGIITTPDYIPPDPPGDPEPGTPINVALYDAFFGVQSELFRGFELDASVSPTQTLYFGGRFKVDLDIGSDGGVTPQFYAPRLFLNRIFGDDRILDINGEPLPTQRDRSQDIALGIEENMVVARLGDGPEMTAVSLGTPPDDGAWHTLIGKLELNVASGANERLSVWLDPTGVETGGTMTQIEADILTDLGDLIGIFHSQGTVPKDPMDPEIGRSYIDDMAIGTTWQDVATVEIPRLTLRINPETGSGRLINLTGSDFDLDGYSIESTAGSLNATGWNSLDDQNQGSWQENKATANQLVETEFSSSSTIASGGQRLLGNLFNTSGITTQDIVGRYSTADGLINLLNIEYSTVEGLAGDFDNDGDVDGHDFLVWQRNPSVGNLADWKTNYGAPAAAVATNVPEPLGIWLASAATVCLLSSRVLQTKEDR